MKNMSAVKKKDKEAEAEKEKQMLLAQHRQIHESFEQIRELERAGLAGPNSGDNNIAKITREGPYYMPVVTFSADTTTLTPSNTPKPLTEFPLFAKLAPELQVKVFNFMLPRADVIELEHLAPCAQDGTIKFSLRISGNMVKKLAERRGIALMSLCCEMNKVYKQAMPIRLPVGSYRVSKHRDSSDAILSFYGHKAPNFLRISTDDLVYFRSYLSVSYVRTLRIQGLLLTQEWAKNLTQIGVYFGLFGNLEEFGALDSSLKGLFDSFPLLEEVRVLESGIGLGKPRLTYDDPSLASPKPGDSVHLGAAEEDRLFKKLEAIQAEWEKDAFFLSRNKPVPRITYL